jgi:hypothetical protein
MLRACPDAVHVVSGDFSDDSCAGFGGPVVQVLDVRHGWTVSAPVPFAAHVDRVAVSSCSAAAGIVHFPLQYVCAVLLELVEVLALVLVEVLVLRPYAYFYGSQSSSDLYHFVLGIGVLLDGGCAGGVPGGYSGRLIRQFVVNVHLLRHVVPLPLFLRGYMGFDLDEVDVGYALVMEFAEAIVDLLLEVAITTD